MFLSSIYTLSLLILRVVAIALSIAPTALMSKGAFVPMIAIEQKNNGVKLLAMVAVIAMVVAGAAVMMNDNGVSAASSDDDSQIYGGMTLSTEQNFTGANIRVVEDLVVTKGGALNISGGNFTIEDGVNVTIQNGGSITVDGGLVTVNGTLTITGSGSTFLIGDQAADEDYSIVINGTVTVAKSGSMAQAADVSGTSNILINDGGILDITKRSTDISSIEDMYIYMNVGATFNLNGNANNVTVQAIGTGTNATFGAVKIDADPSFTKDDRSSSELTFTVTSQNTSALTERDNEKSNVTLRQYIVNVDGTLANGDKLSTVEVAPAGATAFFGTTGYKYQISPIVSITGTLEVENTASMEVAADTQVDVSGTVTFDYDDTTGAYNGTIAVYGSMYITGTMTGYYVNDTENSYVSFTVDNADGNYNRVVVDGGSISLTTSSTLLEFLAANNSARFYGSLYLTDNGSGADDTIYITDFDAAVASGTDEIFVFAFGAQNYATAQKAIDRGAFNVTSDLTIPDGMTVWIWNALVVSEGATLTLEEGAEVIIYQEGIDASDIMTDRDNDGKLFVQGKVVDYYGAMEDYEGVPASSDTGLECDVFVYEVKKVTDTDTDSYVTYTTLKIALNEAVAGEEIQLNGKVTISENMTIPTDVTVSADSTESIGIEVQGATLTVNGVLDMNYTMFDLTTKTGSETVGNIVVNNYVVDVHNTNYNDNAWNMTEYLDGAYFNGIVGDAETESNYISNVEIAANASATVTDNIRIFGNVDMGDVEFTAAEELVNGLIIYIYNDDKDTATAGTVTINNNVFLNTNSGDFTGTVAGAGATIAVEGNKDTTFTVVTIGADEQATTQMQISSMQGNTRVATSDGSITIASGTVYIVASFNTDDMTVAEGATLVIADTGTLNADANPSYRFNTTPGNMPLLTESLASNLAGLTVDGTITVEGQMSADVVYINGTVAIADTGSFTSSFLAYINGAVTSEEGAAANYTVALVNGTVSGDVNAEFVAAFPGSDVSGADIVAPGTTGINSTNYYVNGEQIATVYAENGVAGEIVLLLTDVNGVKYDTSRFYIDSAMTDCVTDFNTLDGMAIYDAINDVITGFRAITYDSASDSYDLTDFRAALDNVTSNFDVGSYENVYIGMEPADVTGTISVGTGLNLYIDSLSWSPNALGAYQLGVGTHTVSFDVTTGYDGTNATITFNGQTVQNGGTIEITADMTSFTLMVSGAVPSSGGTVVIDNGSGDSGMGLTDYLLIILVVLIVIMAIIVALRLMRS